MELRIGLYAFFAYTLSGVGYFSVALTMLWVYDSKLMPFVGRDWPIPMLLLAVVLCYVAGLLLDPVARTLFRLVFRRSARKAAIEEISRHVPEAAELESMYWPLLLAELHLKRETMVDHADTYKAAAILLRNIGTAACLGLLSVAIGQFSGGS